MEIKANLKNLKPYKIRLKLENAVHEFFKKKRYLRLDLPVLSPALIPESYLEIFKTEFNYLKIKKPLYLIPSPELFMKRLLSAGIGDCYYLGKSFRNSEPNSSLHLPEFTMLEFYKLHVNYLGLADEILEMLNYFCLKLKKTNKLFYQGEQISFTRFEKMTIAQAFIRYADIDEKVLFNELLFIKKAAEKGYKTIGFAYEDLFSQIIAQEIEPHLGKNGYPTLLYDYPAKMSSLAKLSRDGNIAQRAEFYIDGKEIGGCCTELNSSKEQEKRFQEQSFKRKRAGFIGHAVDKGFIKALQYGLPDCSGAGIGFDRLAMIFADVEVIDKLKLINISL